jgi:hypothetical protein
MAIRLDEGYQYKIGKNFPITYYADKIKKDNEILNPLPEKRKKVKKGISKNSTKPIALGNPYLSGVVKLNSDDKFSKMETEIEIKKSSYSRTKTNMDLFKSVNDGPIHSPMERSPVQELKF